MGEKIISVIKRQYIKLMTRDQIRDLGEFFLSITYVSELNVILAANFTQFPYFDTFKYHVLCTDGKISVTINLLFNFIFHRLSI